MATNKRHANHPVRRFRTTRPELREYICPGCKGRAELPNGSKCGFCGGDGSIYRPVEEEE